MTLFSLEGCLYVKKMFEEDAKGVIRIRKKRRTGSDHNWDENTSNDQQTPNRKLKFEQHEHYYNSKIDLQYLKMFTILMG